MKRKIFYMCLGALAASTLFVSCQKDVGVPKEATILSTPLPGQTTYCRIESLWLNPGEFNQQFRLIKYDEFENPIFITNPMVGTGTPFRSFKYDSWHRLVQYLETYSNNHFQTWHFYGFDLQGRIGVDTSYTFGFSGTGTPTDYYYRTISVLTYDGQNRIVRSDNSITPDPLNPHVSPSTNVETWTYNSAGNLDLPGTIYDNKVNLNRTNDIWMFLARDYSMNNPFSASTYNSNGYPTAINVPSARFILSTDIFLSNSQIGYSCRDAHW